LKKHTIFIYGNCLRGMDNNVMLGETSKYLGNDIIIGWGLIDIQNYPLAIEARFPRHKTHIRVETYEIDSKVLKKLEKYFNFPKMYDKKIVVSKKNIKGLIFYGNDRKSTLQGTGIPVPDGDWRTYSKVKNNRLELKEKRKKRRQDTDENEQQAQNNNNIINGEKNEKR